MKKIILAITLGFSSLAFGEAGDILEIKDLQVRANTPRGQMRVLMVTAEVCDSVYPVSGVSELNVTSDNSAEIALYVVSGQCENPRAVGMPVFLETILIDAGLDPATAELTFK